MVHSSLRVFFVATVVSCLALWGVQPAFAAVGDWQKGANINPEGPENFSTDSFRQSLVNLANMHANFVSLTIPYYQTNVDSYDIARGWNTPSDSSLISAIAFAHGLGLKVALVLHVDSLDGSWRANINPSNRDAWFSAYGNLVNYYSTLAQQQNVEQMTIGVELIKMASARANPDNTQRWKNIIAQVRARFSGTLTYGANHGGNDAIDEKKGIEFWSDLDFIGISAYHPLSQEHNPSVVTMKNEWNQWNTDEVQPLVNAYHKPVLFTEVGYRSITDAHKDPWNYSRGGCYDPQEQARDYESLLSYWNDVPSMKGFFLWNWESNPGIGGSGNKDFTPHGKPAEQLLSDWFAHGNSALTFSGSTSLGQSDADCSYQAGATSSAFNEEPSVSSSSSTSSSSTSNGNTSSSSIVGGGGGGGGGGSQSSASSQASVPGGDSSGGGGSGGGGSTNNPPSGGGTGGGGFGNSSGSVIPPSGGGTGGGGFGNSSEPSSSGSAIPPPAFGGGPLIPGSFPKTGKVESPMSKDIAGFVFFLSIAFLLSCLSLEKLPRKR